MKKLRESYVLEGDRIGLRTFALNMIVRVPIWLFSYPIFQAGYGDIVMQLLWIIPLCAFIIAFAYTKIFDKGNDPDLTS